MPKDGSMGISEETDVKQAQLAGFLEMHLKMVQGVWKKVQRKPYIYIDLYAGKGKYTSLCTGTERKGSPLIFLGLAESLNIDFRAAFFDSGDDGETIKSLESEVRFSFPEAVSKCAFHGGDNWIESRPYLGSIPPHHSAPWYKNHPNANRYGLIYADPNGNDLEKTWALLSLYSRCSTYRTVDILTYMPATIIKRLRGAGYTEKRLADYMRDVAKHKPYITVREPHTKDQWMFVCFSSWDKFPEWKSKGWYRSDSDDGQRILAHANYTAEEKRNGICPAFPSQPTLFDV